MTKLLLAEDNDFSRDILARRLARCGYAVITASNGPAALLAARAHRPDVILMDLDLPGMDGRSALRSLKNDLRTFQIPVIALAAEASVEEVTQAAAEGCHACEAKPLVLRRLRRRIADLLAGRAGHAGSHAGSIVSSTPAAIKPNRSSSALGSGSRPMN